MTAMAPQFVRPHPNYSDIWVVSEQSTKMIVVDPLVVGKVIQTRDEAVDLALKEVTERCKNKAGAMAILDDVKEAMTRATVDVSVENIK